jgi:DNA-binding response OmpR family regulator
MAPRLGIHRTLNAQTGDGKDLREVWGFRALGRTRTLESHASRLRRKLNVGANDHYVVNVWGVGYRLLD